jgi:hypothetical protein
MTPKSGAPSPSNHRSPLVLAFPPFVENFVGNLVECALIRDKVRNNVSVKDSKLISETIRVHSREFAV